MFGLLTQIKHWFAPTTLDMAVQKYCYGQYDLALKYLQWANKLDKRFHDDGLYVAYLGLTLFHLHDKSAIIELERSLFLLRNCKEADPIKVKFLHDEVMDCLGTMKC